MSPTEPDEEGLKTMASKERIEIEVQRMIEYALDEGLDDVQLLRAFNDAIDALENERNEVQARVRRTRALEEILSTAEP